VDVVCLRRGVLWLIEVKAGWDDVASYDRWCGRMTLCQACQ